MFYLTTYGFAMIGAFAVVTLVRDSGGEADLRAVAGPGRRSPLIAGLFAFFLLSMAGIPLTAGFVGKWAVFTVALSARCLASRDRRDPVQHHRGVLLRAGDRADVLPRRRQQWRRGRHGHQPSVLTSATILVGVAATLVLGIVPGPVLDLAANAGQFVR